MYPTMIRGGGSIWGGSRRNHDNVCKSAGASAQVITQYNPESSTLLSLLVGPATGSLRRGAGAGHISVS